jgi:quercetin dioxygenase-like cupin family protein
MISIIPIRIEYFGFTCVVFSGAVGEGVSQHTHEQQHGLVVLSGKVLVRVDGMDDRQIGAEQGTIYLPPNIAHELEVVSDTAQFITLFKL